MLDAGVYKHGEQADHTRNTVRNANIDHSRWKLVAALGAEVLRERAPGCAAFIEDGQRFQQR
jgi:hypothetical protein